MKTGSFHFSVRMVSDAVSAGQLFIEFTVDTTAQGLTGTAVLVESSAIPPEAAGDVFESVLGGGNVLIADEFSLGLEVLPLDDINSLVLSDEHLHTEPPAGEKFCWLGPRR